MVLLISWFCRNSFAIDKRQHIEQWPYSLLLRNEDVDKNIGNLISPIILAPIFETVHLLGEGKGWYTFSYTFVGGVIFAYFYNKQHENHSENIAFMTTVLLHLIINGLIAYV
tara:strand:- start:778 stop:1113 length:336 start_codon:yes stop_codon:yes gene_type:complete